MPPQREPLPLWRWRAAPVRRIDFLEALAIGFAVIAALVSALPYAGSWNDGSRLAVVESLVDHGTLAIDHSVFVDVPEGLTPYNPASRSLNKEGTKDKLWIDGRFYSDKPLLQSLAMAGLYGLLQQTTGLNVRQNPERFCYWMTILSSGIAYVVAGWAIARIGRVVGLSPGSRLLLTGSFLLATSALPYARHVNQHILLLSIASVIALLMLEVSLLGARTSLRRWAILGGLTGLGYTMDLAAGPLLSACVLGWAIVRCRSLAAGAVMVAAMLPCVTLYHSLNYSIGGTLTPANAHAAFLAWEGSPFTAESITGSWKHTPIEMVGYALELLFGTRGFVLHHPPLLMLVFAVPALVRRDFPFRMEIAALLLWSILTWLAYSAGSNNRSGVCYTIRWFVPSLAASYTTLAALVRVRPGLAVDLGILTLPGMALSVIGWHQGPWAPRMVPGYWIIVGIGSAAWVYSLHWRRPTRPRAEGPSRDVRVAA